MTRRCPTIAADASEELSASLEDYLEAIFWIIKEKQAARAKDIADRLNVARSSVTGALRALAERELVNYTPYDLITLTDRGRAAAEDVARRHEVLRDFLIKVLSVDAKEADETACKMEHTIPEKIIERFVEFAEFVERCPRAGANWLKGFGYYCNDDEQAERCEQCLQRTLDDFRKKSAKMDADADHTTTLAAMERGDKASIVKITGSGTVRRRLLDMGATAGTMVEVERIAPLGDPIEVKIKGYHLTLRKEEAKRISVKPV